IDEQEKLPRAEKLLEPHLDRFVRLQHAFCSSDRACNESAVGEAGQRDEEHAVPKLALHLGRERDAQTCLADSARPGKGEEANARAEEELPALRKLALTSDQRRRGNGQ